MLLSAEHTRQGPRHQVGVDRALYVRGVHCSKRTTLGGRDLNVIHRERVVLKNNVILKKVRDRDGQTDGQMNTFLHSQILSEILR